MELSWQIIHELEQQCGDSFYILDVKRFEKNYQSFLGSFGSIYPNSSLSYSYKTNYIPRLCQTVNGLGGYAEVVSQMEYELAIKIGVHPSRIIFNGPLKTREEIKNAILAGSIVNLDSLQEVSIVKVLAQKYPDRSFTVGCRCSFDIGNNRISRFGLDVESGELDVAFKALKPLENCSISGLHCHFSTIERSLESYKIRTQKILELSDQYFKAQPPKFIDLGGGFYGNMTEELKQQFEGHIPSYQEYAEAIAPQFRDKFPGESGPELILEPGLAVVADVMQFVAKVVGTKTIRSRKFALLVGSIHNIKPTLNNKQLPVRIFRNEENSQSTIAGPVDLVGYTCMEHDCLYTAYSGVVGVNDYAVFENVGAYTIVFKPPFIRPNPPVVSYNTEQNTYKLVRRQEATQDVFCTYLF
jgi:diaminopimelate decarboxylase